MNAAISGMSPSCDPLEDGHLMLDGMVLKVVYIHQEILLYL